RVDEPLAGQAAVGDGVDHHVARGAILDRAAGILELALGPDLDVAAGPLLDRAQPDDRGVADEIDHRAGDSVDVQAHAWLRAIRRRSWLAAPPPRTSASETSSSSPTSPCPGSTASAIASAGASPTTATSGLSARMGARRAAWRGRPTSADPYRIPLAASAGSSAPP